MNTQTAFCCETDQKLWTRLKLVEISGTYQEYLEAYHTYEDHECQREQTS